MINRIVYYFFILPISFLPYPVLYLLSDFTFFLMYYLVGYRKKVVLTNLRKSFPEKTSREHRLIMTKFYSHFIDLVFEGLKGFTISEQNLRNRFKLMNPELIDGLYEEGKDIIIAGGHYNNWEMLALGIGLKMKHYPIGIYKPLSNKYIGDKMKHSRVRFRLGLSSMRDTKKTFEKNFGEPNGIIFGIDQSPSNIKRCHWVNFLNQDTPVFFGAEKFAKMYNRPVVFVTIHKVKRGYYEGEFKIITENPADLPHGSITEMNTRELEKDIIEKPEFWLWTHNRWKHKRPVINKEREMLTS